MRGVIAKSSNIGTVMLSRQMPTADLHDYLKNFGLGARTGIELPGEDIGILPGADMQGLTRDRVAFGQGLTVTGIQEISAIAGLVNGGVYNSADHHQGRHRQRRSARSTLPAAGTPPDRLRRHLVPHPRPDAGRGGQLGQDRGAAAGRLHQRRQDRHRAARHRRTGYKGYITSYVGYAPLNDPQIMTYVVVNNPQGSDPTGTQVAAPVYRDIMQFALPRYSVEPTKKSVLKPKNIKW